MSSCCLMHSKIQFNYDRYKGVEPTPPDIDSPWSLRNEHVGHLDVSPLITSLWKRVTSKFVGY